MNRVEFTRSITKLIAQMFKEGELPIIDYVKRSDDEQMRLYLRGLSKCDGIHSISWHQRGRAADIYFLNEAMTEVVPPKKGFQYWHDYWTNQFKGHLMIEWDQNHFE